MRARALLLAALTALACARPCSPSEFADAMDVAAARRVLGVEGVASAEQTRAAFHRASLRAHPDKPGGSHEAFVEVTEAYDVLRNGGQESRSGFASGEPWRGQSRGGHSREGDAPARSGFSSGESHAFAWRFSSPYRNDADAGAETSAERSARAREFERFHRARHAWEPRGSDAEFPNRATPPVPAARGGTAERKNNLRRAARRERGATNGFVTAAVTTQVRTATTGFVTETRTRTRIRIRTT